MPAATFGFSISRPGTYAVFIRAAGYQTTRILPDLLVTAEIPEVAFQTAIARQPQGLKQIGYVVTAGRTALQTTTTINTHIDTAVIQSENYQRLADVLTTVPGVITSTSSSVGDDMTLSIRGYDPTETATLLDGHPIGPIGAFGGGYNYNVSPFWGLSGADVIFGSGATGLFGATTIAGAVNFQTINPTQQNHVSVTQGVGSNNKAMTGLLGTGTLGKLGYAIAWGSQGTTGNFPGGFIQQTALLQTSVVNPGIGPPFRPSSKASPPPPDLTNANAFNEVNYYPVSGGYVQRNFVGKLVYDFSPKTTLQFTTYSAQDWSNSTGEGDNDYETFPYVLYGAQQTLASIEATKKGLNTILVNGKPESCHDSIAVLIDNPQGYTCMTPGAVRGQLLRAVRRQHRSLAHAGRRRLRRPRHATARQRAHHARRLRRQLQLQRAERPGRGDRTVRSRPELSRPLRQSRLSAQRRLCDVEERLRVRL